MTFIYLSGAGTSSKGRQQWQKIKSLTELETQQMGFAHAFGWRPDSSGMDVPPVSL
ncbi:MAG: hypothetical protein MJY79_08765 [Bacteroidaceae bacterium]|nr:hypothetical protein [Bacteroidaceae bacterium]